MQIELGKTKTFTTLGFYPELTDDQETLIRNNTDLSSQVLVHIELSDSRERFSAILLTLKKEEQMSERSILATARQIAQVFRNSGEIVHLDEALKDISSGKTLFESSKNT